MYDPRSEVKGGTRIEFETRAEQYLKKKTAEDREARKRLKETQGDLL